MADYYLTSYRGLVLSTTPDGTIQVTLGGSPMFGRTFATIRSAREAIDRRSS